MTGAQAGADGRILDSDEVHAGRFASREPAKGLGVVRKIKRAVEKMTPTAKKLSGSSAWTAVLTSAFVRSRPLLRPWGELR